MQDEGGGGGGQQAGERLTSLPWLQSALMAMLSSSTESHEEDNGGWSSFVSMRWVLPLTAESGGPLQQALTEPRGVRRAL